MLELVQKIIFNIGKESKKDISLEPLSFKFLNSMDIIIVARMGSSRLPGKT